MKFVFVLNLSDLRNIKPWRENNDKNLSGKSVFYERPFREQSPIVAVVATAVVAAVMAAAAFASFRLMAEMKATLINVNYIDLKCASAQLLITSRWQETRIAGRRESFKLSTDHRYTYNFEWSHIKHALSL